MLNEIRRVCSLCFLSTFYYLTAFAGDPFAENIRTTEPLTPEAERKTFHVPPGFEVELVASEPEIGKPINLAFDARGRLWLTQSREYPIAAPLDKPGRDKVKILSDFGSDGRAGKVSTFAEGLNIPIGLYPYKNGVIAFSIPNIYYFQDTDGDGQSDKRELVLGRFGFDRDVHGLTGAFRRGFDGWIYADHGFNNNTTLTATDGSTITMNSGNCYRFRPDGSRVEQYSWGQVNPFGLMFDPLGDLWSADCHSAPVYQLLRGAYYPSFGKPNDGLGFGPDICDHSHGSTAIAGMVYYAAEDFPPEYRGNTFIGNVMTCRINRDSLVAHGSTRITKEEPDFLVSDDPWFRPVDIQLGPDGALYMADFYNRIIGHYEVALDHPGRDRERGRIWRIVYRGKSTPSDASRNTFDLSRSSPKELIQELANPNITRRRLAADQLVDRVGRDASNPIQQMLRDKNSNSFQKTHGLWVLQRLGELNEKALAAFASDADHAVRVHVMRILSETTSWSRGEQKMAWAGLKDTNPYVQRAAADAIGRHPGFQNIEPMLALRASAPADDKQLVHTVRMALRNQLLSETNFAQLRERTLSEKDARAIADVSLGVPSAEAGRYLWGHVQRFAEPREKLSLYMRHIVRYISETEIGSVADFVRAKFNDDLDFQLALFKAIQEGAGQRGTAIPTAMSDWGAELAERLLISVDVKTLDWRNSAIKGGDATNPWFLETRSSADGDQNSQFISSLSPGGEKLTGILKSREFSMPDRLSFFLAGHDGSPDKPARKKNVVRLRDAATGKVLMHADPPRNDVAQPVTWNLRAHAGKQGYLEIVDGNAGFSYAWLAVGRFKPEVVPLPKIIPNQVDKRQIAAAQLVTALGLAKLEPQLSALLADSEADPESRAAAGKALSRLWAKSSTTPDTQAVAAKGSAATPKDQLLALAKILFSAEEPMALREKIAEVLGELNATGAKNVLVEALPSAATSLQKAIALALASSDDGADALLRAIQDGKASGRLLQERNVKDRLSASHANDIGARLEKLTASFPPANAERQKLIDDRRAAFEPAAASAARGAEIFKQNCAVCHTLDGQGALIGPQLDGVGARGADRIMEDILDPSRNVDRAFRTTLLTMKDGDVQSGLFRREEGEMLVFAQQTGKEIFIPKKEVQSRRESETSLMPDNFSEIIPIQDFNDLIAFLLSKRAK
jgi:putative heme-binding domain-containing protein